LFNAAWYWWGGYLLVRASGEHVERFLNLLVSQGVQTWGVRRHEKGVVLFLSVGAFRGIRPTARQTHTRVHIVQRIGLPFFLRQFRHRRMLVAGALLSAVTLYILSSFIWFIELNGLETLTPGQVLGEAAEYGIAPGKLRRFARIEDFEYELPMKVKKVAWVGVSTLGTKVTIEVIEQTLPPGDAVRPREPADVVAAKAGLITEILVLAGRGLVEKGDTVTAGQRLISGIVQASEAGGEQTGEASGGELRVQARGRVKARVWYEAYAEAPIMQIIAKRTGATYVRRMIRLGAEEIMVRGRSPVPFERYEVERQTRELIPWRKGTLPVEVITLRYHEVVHIRRWVGAEEAANQAAQEARERLAVQVPRDAEVQHVTREVVSQHEGVVGVRVIVETIEDIGVTVPLDQSD